MSNTHRDKRTKAEEVAEGEHLLREFARITNGAQPMAIIIASAALLADILGQIDEPQAANALKNLMRMIEVLAEFRRSTERRVKS
jgi:hypothetical protein